LINGEGEEKRKVCGIFNPRHNRHSWDSSSQAITVLPTELLLNGEKQLFQAYKMDK
jgi:hypothetical protein